MEETHSFALYRKFIFAHYGFRVKIEHTILTKLHAFISFKVVFGCLQTQTGKGSSNYYTMCPKKKNKSKLTNRGKKKKEKNEKKNNPIKRWKMKKNHPHIDLLSPFLNTAKLSY